MSFVLGSGWTRRWRGGIHRAPSSMFMEHLRSAAGSRCLLCTQRLNYGLPLAMRPVAPLACGIG